MNNKVKGLIVVGGAVGGYMLLNGKKDDNNSSGGGGFGFTSTKPAIGSTTPAPIIYNITEGDLFFSEASLPEGTPISKKASYSGIPTTNSFGDKVYSDNFVGPLPKGAIHETTSTKKEMSADNKKFGGYNEFFQPVSKIPTSYNPFKR